MRHFADRGWDFHLILKTISKIKKKNFMYIFIIFVKISGNEIHLFHKSENNWKVNLLMFLKWVSYVCIHLTKTMSKKTHTEFILNFFLADILMILKLFAFSISAWKCILYAFSHIKFE